jgi:GH24 family phage-related lysozyme (muramidase)
MIPESLLDHLKLREGVINSVYEDSLGKLTAGVGHLLSRIERSQHPLYSTVPQHQIDAWLKADSEKAWEAACRQSKWLKCPEIKHALFSVIFQLGTEWYTIHRRTWGLMWMGRYKDAAIEVEDSLWSEQTPIRVQDFKEALLAV